MTLVWKNARTHFEGHLEDDGAAPGIANKQRALERLADDQVEVYGMRRFHIQKRSSTHSAQYSRTAQNE